MTKLEYSDFYKFISSLGIVLISIALFLPWLFVHEPFGIDISVDDLEKLTPVAQEIISTQQSVLLWFLHNFKWLSAFLGLTGIVFLFLGVFLWAKRQRTVDTKEDLELIKLKREIDSMTPVQIVEKAISETKSDAVEKPESLSKQKISNPVLDYLRVEELIVKKMSDCFGDDYVLPNRQLKDKGYDIILLSNKRGVKDLVFEIKVTTRGMGSALIESAVLELMSSLERYKLGVNRTAVGVVLLVILGENVSQKIIDQQKQIFMSIIQRHNASVKSIIFTEKQLLALDCNDLREMFP